MCSVSLQHKQNKEYDKPATPCPVCRISLVPVIKWAKNLERAASFVNKERLTEASRTKHSSAQKQQMKTLREQVLSSKKHNKNQISHKFFKYSEVKRRKGYNSSCTNIQEINVVTISRNKDTFQTRIKLLLNYKGHQ